MEQLGTLPSAEDVHATLGPALTTAQFPRVVTGDAEPLLITSLPGAFTGPSVATIVGAAQVGTTVSGSTYYWIGANSTFAPVTTGTSKWIVAQNFNVTQAGTYDFKFTATVDNELTFFVGGALNFDDPQQPTVVGGTQIGTTLSGTGKFRSLWDFEGAAPLAVGQNTAYAVVRDWGAVTGVTITESSYVLVTPVPEPSTWAMAVAVIACGGWRVCRRRRPACRMTVEKVSPAHSGP